VEIIEMPITHEEARQLIQFNADEALISQKQAILSAHLQDCTECRTYAEDIREVESILLPLMKHHWDLRQVTLSINAITRHGISRIRTNILLSTRTAIIGMVFAAFALVIWQFTLSGQRTATPMPINVLPVPTPSTQSTSTTSMVHNCDQILYKVREGDTLQRIASEFSVSKDEIMTANNMETEAIRGTMELIIPLCNFTPTVTQKTTTPTTTYTPVTIPLSSTPDG